MAFATGHCHRFADFDDILAPKRNSRTPAIVVKNVKFSWIQELFGCRPPLPFLCASSMRFGHSSDSMNTPVNAEAKIIQ